MQTFITIGLFLLAVVGYIMFAKLLVKNFKKSTTVSSRILWGFLLIGTFSWLFSSSQNNYNSYGGSDDNELDGFDCHKKDYCDDTYDFCDSFSSSSSCDD